ncbi:MAG: tetratricopeptide repeat protein [Saprospiraceae bacterium]|nr:tetratricopeptide repeat protein [Saprospiraceae bacterium]
MKKILTQVFNCSRNVFLSLLTITLSAQTSTTPASTKEAAVDTTELTGLYNIALEFYETDQSDSCKKYASHALQLTNRMLLDPDQDRKIQRKCQLLKVQLLELIGSELYYENAPSALDTFQVILAYCEEIGDSSGIAMAHASIATIYSDRAEHNRALLHYHAALDLYLQMKDLPNVGETYYYIGLDQRYSGTYGDAFESTLQSLRIGREISDSTMITNALLSNGFLLMYDSSEALRYQREALDIFMRQNDSNGIATVYNDMGVVYWQAGDLDAALKHHLQALAIRERLHDYAHMSSSHNYISEVLQEQGALSQALSHIFEALKYSELDGGSFQIDAYMDAGKIYLQMGEYANARKYYHSAVKISELGQNNQQQAEAMEGIAEVYLMQEQYSDALTWLLRAAKTASKDDFRVLSSVYGGLSHAYFKIKDYKRAYENQVLYKSMSDSLIGREQNEKITSLSKQLEFENTRAIQKASQEKQLAVQQSEIKRQKVVRNFSIAGLFFVIILALIYFIRFKEKGKLNVTLENMITNLKATQAQLIQSEKMSSLGELTAGIAHEIQNPLNFVNNFSEVSTELIDELNVELEKGDLGLVKDISRDLKSNLVKINEHGARASSIVRGMLDHSRTSSGEMVPTDINMLCDEYLRLAYHGIRAKQKNFNAELKTELDPTLQKIEVVPQDIGRVLLNLINNGFHAVASKAASTDQHDYRPTVVISTKGFTNKIEIKVKDNGNGIPGAIIEKIFQPFFTTKPAGQGTGLGLSLSYDIVNTHGGTIDVDTVEGVGTEFTIVLPLKANLDS